MRFESWASNVVRTMFIYKKIIFLTLNVILVIDYIENIESKQS